MNIPMINLPMTGANINSFRKKANMTVRDIQKIFGFSTPQAIYKWIHGKSLPSIDNLLILADVFDVSIEDILSVDYNQQKKKMGKTEYYRIVYFKNNKFQKTVITSNTEEVEQLIRLRTPEIEIYKCNSKGNNYTGRKIYPFY